MKIVATNIIASLPSERWSTGTLTACAKIQKMSPVSQKLTELQGIFVSQLKAQSQFLLIF